MIVDQYFYQGVKFLHKLFLALLLWMKNDLLVSGEETLVKMGSTYLKTLVIPWDKVIDATQYFSDM